VADFHWPELHKLMPDNRYFDDRSILSEKCQQNIIENPHIATWFFHRRFENFFNDVLKSRWDLEDWWYRFEWQYRGSVYVHSIGKMKNAPVIDWNQMKDNETLINEAIQYIDSLITTINPGINVPIPRRHPCQKISKELTDNTQDYIELINKLQYHTCCSSSYCLRTKRNGQTSC
jgi:hypothetical protein